MAVQGGQQLVNAAGQEFAQLVSHAAMQYAESALRSATSSAGASLAKTGRSLFQAPKRKRGSKVRPFQKKAKKAKSVKGGAADMFNPFKMGGILGPANASHLVGDPSIKAGRVIKKSGFGKRKRRRSKKKQSFKSKVMTIANQQIESANRNRHKFKNTAITWGQVGHAVNVCAYEYFINASLSNIDDAWSNVDMVEAVGTGYATVNMTAIPGVTLHNINFYDVRIYRNNQSMPCYFEVWECTAKRGNTSALNPHEAITRGLNDLNLSTGLGGANEPTTTDQLFEISPLKSKVFRS